MSEPASNTPDGPQSLIAWSAVGGCSLYGMAYGISGLAGLLPGASMGPRVVNATFLLCGGASLGAVAGFVAGCLGATARWLAGRRKRNTPV